MSTSFGPAPLAVLKTTLSALIGAPVFMLVAVFFVLGDTLDDPLPLTYLAIVVALAAASATVTPLIGYRTTAIAPGTPAEEAATASRLAFSGSTYLRFALTEVVAIASLALAFVADEGGFVVFLLGGVLSMVLMAAHAWPSERAITRVEQSLERDGGRSHLRESLGA